MKMLASYKQVIFILSLGISLSFSEILKAQCPTLDPSIGTSIGSGGYGDGIEVCVNTDGTANITLTFLNDGSDYDNVFLFATSIPPSGAYIFDGDLGVSYVHTAGSNIYVFENVPDEISGIQANYVFRKSGCLPYGGAGIDIKPENLLEIQDSDITIVNNTRCIAPFNGSISIITSGGTGTISFDWTGPNGFTASTQNISGLEPGTYSITLTDEHNCSYTRNIDVLDNSVLPVISFSGLDPSGLYCISDGIVTITGSEAPNGTFSGPGITDNGNGTADFDPSAGLSGDIIYTYTDGLGCTGTYSETVTVNTSPPDATITAAGPFCESDASVTLTAATAGGTWSGTGITDANAGTFDPATAGVGSHVITYTVTVGGCTSVDTETIDVNPSPDATITAAGPFCETDVSVTLTAATAGGTWSGTGITDVNAGTFDPATAGAGSHVITYSVTVAGCTSVDTETMVVDPLPDATITAAGPFCETDASVTLTAATAGGTWSGTGITDANAGTFDPATAGAGSHVITYSITVGSCTSVDTETIVVDPLPDATITAAGPFCETDVSVTLTAATAGGTWSGTGITDVNAGTFDPATAGAGSHVITYSVTVGGCTSVDTETIDVNPSPDATITAAGPFCETDVSVTLTAATAGGTWSGTGITDVNAGTFDPATAGAGSHVITYSVTVAGCTSVDTETMVVDPLPDATITAAGPFCETDASVTLTAATAGGTWSGTGITDANAGTFDPATAGAGSHVITYSVTVGGCTSVDTETIDVNPSPDATITAAGPFCETDVSVTLTAATAGGTWSGTGITDVNAGTFDPATAGAGSHVITYSVTVAGCTSVDTETMVVDPLPDVTITAAGPFCETDASVTLTAATAGGTWSGTGITDANAGTFDPATAGAGSHVITYSITVGSCTSVDTETIVVDPTANPSINGPSAVCLNSTVIYTTESGNSNYIWNIVGGTLVSGGIGNDFIEITWDGVGPNYSVEVNYQDVNGCSSPTPTTQVIAVSSGTPPSADLSGSTTTCAGATIPLTVNLTGTGPWTFEYTDGTNSYIENINATPYSFDVSATTTTTFTPLTVSDAICTGTVSGSATVTITPPKEVKIRLDSISGAPGSTVTVPVQVIDYEDLMTMQFTVAWDPNLLTYSDVTGISLQNPSGANFGTSQVTNGFLNFSWATGLLADTTIVDSTAIFSVEFILANTVCSDASVSIDETLGALTPIEIADENLCLANVTVVGGNVENQVTASITSSDADNLICSGDQVIFTGLPGGMTNYDFYLNGAVVQSGANGVYVTNSLADQDSVNVIVGDTQGCTLAAQGIITSVNQITIAPIITDITTCGGLDGVIDPGVSGGSGTYTYQWTGPDISDPTLSVQSGLGRGFYTVEVNDGTCTESLTIELKEPVTFTLSANTIDVSTTGGSDGEIDLIITGGTGPFSVSWEGPNGYTSNDEDINNLFAGEYTATVTDGSGVCADALVVQITQPMNALILSATKTDVSTCGAMDGTINLIITGGSGSFTISWIGPNGYTSSSQNIAGLEGGLYIATVVDMVTSLSAQWLVQVDEPAGFTIQATASDIIYCSSADGSISLNIIGGSGDFSYLWSDLSGLGFTSTDKDIADLVMGTYRVVVIDNISGCVDSADAVVGRPAICDQPCTLYVESTTNNTSCPDTEDGVAVINIIGGGSGPGNYWVSLDTGKTFVPFLGQDITAIIDQGQGSYLYIVKDTITGCTDQTVANVGVSTNLMANISVADAGCTEDDGMITFNVSGGVVPFEVDIVDSLGNVTSKSGNGFFQFMDLTPGSYFYSVREQSGCTIVASDSIEVGVDCQTGCSSLIASAHSFEDATCGSDPNGKAIIDVTGGSSPYEYSVDGTNWIPFISGNVIDQLPPNGTYNIAIRQDEDNADCRTTVNVTINGPELITLQSPIMTTQRASCNQNDGAVKVGKVVGGTGAYNYQMDGTFITLPSDSIITDLGAGFHTFSVIDAVACQADFTFEVESPGVIVASATDVPVSCTSIFLKAGIRIEIDLDSTTLPGPYEAYVASANDPDNGIIYQIPDNGVRTILNLDKDFYNINISSGVDGGCTFSETVAVFSGASPVDFDIIDSDSIVSCIGDLGSITIGNVIGDQDVPFFVHLVHENGDILETYEVQYYEFEGGFTIDETNTDKLVAGQYYIRIIQNQSECEGVVANSNLITIYEPLGQLAFNVEEFEVSLADRPTGYIFGEVLPSGGDPYEARIQLLEPIFEMNVTDIIEFNEKRRWEEVPSTGENLNRYPHRFDSLWAGTYEIGVRDAYGCEFYIEHTIGYDETVFIPNVFTPNGDGYNDTFYIRNLPESGTKVIISNRNGFVVYKSDDYNIDTLWDGGNLSDGIYYYNISMPNGDNYKGWVEKWSGARP